MITPASPWRTTGPCPPDDWHRVLAALPARDRDATYDVAGPDGAILSAVDGRAPWWPTSRLDRVTAPNGEGG